MFIVLSRVVLSNVWEADPWKYGSLTTHYSVRRTAIQFQNYFVVYVKEILKALLIYSRTITAVVYD